MRATITAVLLTGCSFAAQSPGWAQSSIASNAQPGTAAVEASADQSQDIVVTATKRSQSLREIPAAISAVGSETLQQKTIVQINDLNGLVPGLQVSNNNNDVNLTIRGVGHTSYSPVSDNSVALHLDGVYLSRPPAAQNAFFDVNRIEVLRGPQGTLYGRNASGGAVNVVSNDPTSTLSGYASGSYGNYNRVDLEGVVSGPLAGDALTARLGAFYHRHGGFGKNLPTGDAVDSLDSYGGKAAITARPTDRLKITIRGDYFHASDSLGLYHFGGITRQPFSGSLPLPFCSATGRRRTSAIRTIRSGTRVPSRIGGSAAFSTMIWATASAKSTTAYRHDHAVANTWLTGTPIALLDPISIMVRAHQVSEELQLNWKTDNLYVLVGGYYFRERLVSRAFIDSYLAEGIPTLRIPRILPAPFGVFDQNALNHTNAKAIFANVDWDVLPRLHLGAGIRYSQETKKNDGYEIAFFPSFAQYPGVGYETVDESRSSHALTPRVSVRYDFTSDLNGYASISRGFKGGEFIAGTDQYAKPERLWAYEAGLKASLLDHKLQGSVGGFYYDYSNLQVERTLVPVTFLENVRKATLWGFEAEAVWRLPGGFRLDGNATYLKTRNGGFVTQDPNVPGNPTVDLRGRRFAFAPTITLNGGIEKQFQFARIGTGTFRFDAQHTSDTYLDIFQSKSANFRPANSILNASYRQTFGSQGRYSLQLWGKNLTNRTVFLNGNVASVPNLIVPQPGSATPPYPNASIQEVNLNEPRTYGITLRVEW